MQLRREVGRWATRSPGMAWKDQGDAHPVPAPLLAGGRPETQHPRPSRSDCSHSCLQCAQPSPPAEDGHQGAVGPARSQGIWARGQKPEGQDHSIQDPSGPTGLILLGPTSGGLGRRGPVGTKQGSCLEKG